MRNLLAFDIGASNGRAILGQFDGERISMRELHRFENHYVEMNGIYYWDLPYIYNQLKQGFLAFRRADIGALDCFGIDTWGVDYGLLDKNGHLLSNPRAYRNAVEEDCTEAWKAMDFPALFAHTGIGNESFNTAYQLYRRKREDDAALEAAETLLFMPDLLGYFLTGEKKSEYTETTTSMLYNPIKRDWDRDIMAAFGLPEKIFPPIDMPGTMRGRLRSDIARELGINCAAFAAVGTHDTASAVAAIPGSGSFARCIYESLALKYRYTLERLGEIKGHAIESLNIVGGGSRNRLLNRFAADAAGCRVITGPIEGAAIGNLLVQAMALGDISGIDELRDIVRRCEAVECYEPNTTAEWEAAYGRLLGYMERSGKK